MWKYLNADDEGVSDTKAKMKKYDSSARMRNFNYRGYMVGHGYDTIKLPARCIVVCASTSE